MAESNRCLNEISTLAQLGPGSTMKASSAVVQQCASGNLWKGWEEARQKERQEFGAKSTDFKYIYGYNKRDRVGLFNGEKCDVCRRPVGWFEHVQKRDRGCIGQRVFNIELPGPGREEKDHREESLM